MSKKRCKDQKAPNPEEVKYICKKCGREAKKEKHLCKPKEK